MESTNIQISVETILRCIDNYGELSKQERELLEPLFVRVKYYPNRVRGAYYQEEYGMWLAPKLDEMLKENKEIVIKADEPVGHGKSMSVGTLRQKLLHSWYWLMENHRDRLVYTTLRKSTKVSMDIDSLRVVWKTKVVTGVDGTTLEDAEIAEERERALATDNSVWKRLVTDFVENSEEGDILDIVKDENGARIYLPRASQDYIKKYLEPFNDTFTLFINDHKLKVINSKEVARVARGEG